MSSEDNLFQAVTYDDEYWANYLAARPKYHRSGFYDKVFDYHNAHAAGYDTVHDVGTGPGQVAGMLVHPFQHVVASDLNETHLSICKHRNAESAEKMSFLLCKGEDVANSVPAASADAIFSGEALILMDYNKAVESFAQILKPGGTLAVWYYGRPTFSDGDNAASCQDLYDRIANRQFGKIIKGGSAAKTAYWEQVTDAMASWLDSVAFSADKWTDVERHKWNVHGKMTFYDEDACDFTFDVPSRITASERVTENRDDELWAEMWNASEVKRFIDANLPSFKHELNEDAEVDGLYQELEKAMGGREAKRRISWPVVLLLATRK